MNDGMSEVPAGSIVSPMLPHAPHAGCTSTRLGWTALLPARPDHGTGSADGIARAAVRSQEEEQIAPFVDALYYRETYSDVLASDIDPVVHYTRHGWKERRNPSRSFDTGFYLDSNPDIVGLDINPLWHYVVTGREEGRRAVGPVNIGLRILRNLVDPEQREKDRGVPDGVAVLDCAVLQRLLAEQSTCAAFAISVSHDDYTSAVGGTQVFIASEQEKFAGRDTGYLHISPLMSRLRLATSDDGVSILRLILNGRPVGLADANELTDAIAAVTHILPSQRLLICHCLLGHRPEEIAALHGALRPNNSIFWLHDYSSICPSVTLLRNDVTFCGAPPADSNACRICVYGRARSAHVERLQTLFSVVSFDVVAPSATALDLWLSRAGLPARSTHLHPHAHVRFTSRRRSLVPIAQRGTAACPIRVAFAGHPATHKGWPAFSALLDACSAFKHFEFYHFWAEAGAATQMRVKSVIVSGHTRDDMIRALGAHGIDLVLVLSTWPETFSFVTYESIAAGADVVAFADSGHVAAEVLRSGRGLVMQDFSALMAFFVSGTATHYVRLCYEQGNAAGDLVRCGTTATLLKDLPDITNLPDRRHSLEARTRPAFRRASAIRG